MILIYNASGLLVGLLAFGVTYGVALVTGHEGFGFLLGGGICIWLGRKKKRKREGGKYVESEHVAPSLFFIPLAHFSGVFFLFALLLMFGSIGGRTGLLGLNRPSRRPPARKQISGKIQKEFKADQRVLVRNETTGDKELGANIRKELRSLVEKKHDKEAINILTKTKKNRLLVMVKTTIISTAKEDLRKKMLDTVTGVIRSQDELKERDLYVGLWGRGESCKATQIPNGSHALGGPGLALIMRFYSTPKKKKNKSK